MLTLKDINVSFGKNHVLRNLSCQVDAGDFVVIVGANGQGKSTLFDVIAGRIKPQSGSIALDGSDVTHLNELQRAGMVTRIFQNTRLNSVGGLTVAQNLAIAHYGRRRVRPVDGMDVLPRAKAQEIIKEIGMDVSVLDRSMNALSGGQRQLIAFVMSMQLTPKILLLDEPTAALDPQSATKLLHYAARYIKEHKITTLLITHDPQIALHVGNRVWVLENGKLSKQFSEQDKKSLHPDQLIGQIDYQKICL
jgi:putative ABC transport system ATP-binding protein